MLASALPPDGSGMFQFMPDPNLGRRQQIFQIWIRPVEPQNSLFALRAALFEYDKLVREGMRKEDFEAIREFLVKYGNVLTSTQTRQLGYALDSEWYGISEFTSFMRDALRRLTGQQVNAAIRKHLSAKDLSIVIITKDAAGLKQALVSEAPSPIKYDGDKPASLLAEDKVVGARSTSVSETGESS